jgi:hypothetical protein
MFSTCFPSHRWGAVHSTGCGPQRRCFTCRNNLLFSTVSCFWNTVSVHYFVYQHFYSTFVYIPYGHRTWSWVDRCAWSGPAQKISPPMERDRTLCLDWVFPSHRASTPALLAVWGFRPSFCTALCDICWCKKGFINKCYWLKTLYLADVNPDIHPEETFGRQGSFWAAAPVRARNLPSLRMLPCKTGPLCGVYFMNIQQVITEMPSWRWDGSLLTWNNIL